MKCPSCGLNDLKPIDGADVHRCPNCLWSVPNEDVAASQKRSRAAKKAAKKRSTSSKRR